MRRRHLYFAVIGGVIVLALALRVHSAWQRRPRGAVPPVRIADGPVDYVKQPWIAPGEALAGPQRIISLAPSNTEILCALGLRDRLIGRTQYCVYPPGLESVPIVGALTDANYEKIKALRPDLVLVTENSQEVIRKLQAIRVPYETVVHETLEEVYSAIARVGAVTGRPRTASALIGAIWTDLDCLKRAARPHPDRRVLLALSMPVPPAGLYVAGPGTFLDNLLQLAGYVNPVRDLPAGKFGELPLEKLTELNPDVIVEFGSPRSPEQLSEMYASWSAIPGLTAIERRRVLSMGGSEWLSAGPRIAIELHRLMGLLDHVQADGG